MKCIKAVKNALVNQKSGIVTNLFHDNSICELGITFLWEGREFSYDDDELLKMIPLVSQSNLLIHMIDISKFERLAEIKHIVVGFASKIDIVNMNNIPMERTINLMKNENDLQKKVVEFIKNADLYMDDFGYTDIDKLPLLIDVEKSKEKPEEKALDIPDQLMDQIRLVSVYKGIAVPSILFDSTGKNSCSCKLYNRGLGTGKNPCS